eukprot:m.43415 g.43415  ORF g.43415 m.43415 type:complete len:331 (+) comp9975_c0_seq2:3350-4342(+)
MSTSPIRGSGDKKASAQPDDVEAIRVAMSRSNSQDKIDQAGQETPKVGGDADNIYLIDEVEHFTSKKGKLRNAIMECDFKAFWELQDKGSISNFATFLIMIVGVIGSLIVKNNVVWETIKAAGLFGFSGGITNWLAVKMLFDSVPGLYGSGIITKQFKEIRQTVMDTVLETFFDVEFLGKYAGDKADELEKSDFLVGKVREILQSEETDKLVAKHVAAIFLRPEGMMMAMAGFNAQSLQPVIMPFVVGMDTEIAGVLMTGFDPKSMIQPEAMREQVKELMATKAAMLTPGMVKELVEDMIRKHLGWLIVWGNLFGGMIGVICLLASWYAH